MSKPLHTISVLFLTAIFLCTSCLVPTARAAIISIPSYLDQAQTINGDELAALIDREDVRQQLIELGVNPEDAKKRIASLSQSELRMLQQKIDNLPSGGDALAILGAVLLVLIILEILGVTNVFSNF